MDIGSTIQNTAPGSQLSLTGGSGNSAISSDFETFINMLTVQMENQDPLNPVEASDFAVQLATFSTVEQQVLTNNLLTSLGAQIGALSVSQLSGWIGMEARVQMPVEFDGAPVTLSLRANSLADSAELVVQDSQGTEVARQSVPLAGGEYEWAGTDDSGDPLPEGSYQVSVESFSNGESIGSLPAEVHAIIVEARNDNGVPTLLMNSGQTVVASDILGLSDPET